jgi:hypothetical protein
VKEEGRRKKEEGRRKKEEGRGKREEGRGKILPLSPSLLSLYSLRPSPPLAVFSSPSAPGSQAGNS